MPSPCTLLFLFFFFSLCVSSPDLLLDQQESDHLYAVLSSLNPSVDWRSDYPDDLCTSGPHGVVCEPLGDSLRVVELSFGYVSDYSNNPPCHPSNASFSPSLSRFPFLSKLFFYRCFTNSSLVSLPSFLWSLGPQLQELVFEDNPAIAGPLSADIANLTGLRRLIISGSNLSGLIPQTIAALSQVQQIDLSGNRLTGPIPPAVGNLTELIVLDLSRNQLTGPLPPELGQLSKATKLDLSFNNISGEIPASLGELRGLEMFVLSNNSINGGLPLFLGRMQGLRDLHLGGNPLGGTLPDVWTQLAGLVSLDLAYTGLVGIIPASMARLRNLTYLSLDHNGLTGAIPSGLGGLPLIHDLDLSYNRLSGQVPFREEVVERLGPKLKLAGNDGLCLGSKMVGAGLVRVDVNGCISSNLAESLARDSSAVSSRGSRLGSDSWYGVALALLPAYLLTL
ncbi:receptor like protein 29-like [Nymphaea colorata]|uniref:Leucine-rich repeat-containing N-terminal plant-type domain-containing protein n=1 Tax=Nymphaea colorata TaxID=210225 RepID=A0A5K0ZVF5_9MAGN|nr:receptor like protein 29-like [Nymphaea colorata]